uniref:Retrovirus-related Pol polyprotein from transposon TNT 1-94-like beta-barrel domain-containing protein n=1 Tax=Oryza glaberrima TaxID=4538 RepID=I1QRU7_ORYGL
NSTSQPNVVSNPSNPSTSNGCARCYNIDLNSYAINVDAMQALKKENERLGTLVKYGCMKTYHSKDSLYKTITAHPNKDGHGLGFLGGSPVSKHVVAYSSSGSSWVVDSGCTNHMTRERSMFTSLDEEGGSRENIVFGDDGKGKVDEGFLLGYESNVHAYRVFNKTFGIVEVTRDATFDESNGSQGEQVVVHVVGDMDPSQAIGTKAIGDIRPIETQDDQEDRDQSPSSTSNSPTSAVSAKPEVPGPIDQNIRTYLGPKVPGSPVRNLRTSGSEDVPTAQMDRIDAAGTLEHTDQAQVPPVHHPRIHHTVQRDHPVDNILGDIRKGVTTRSRVASFCQHFSFVSSLAPTRVEDALGDPDWVMAMQEELNNCTHNQMSMMGELTFFLGLQVKQAQEDTFISQTKYVKDILKKFGMEDAKPIKTPMPTNDHLDLDDNGKCVDQKGCDFELLGYSNSDYAGCKVDRKSTTRTCQFLGRSLVSWSSKKQNSIALSTAEAEYVAAGSCCAQLFWMKQTLNDFGYNFTKIPLLCDNESAIKIANNPVQHSRTKHIDICHHFLRDHETKGDICLTHVRTETQLADICTMPLDEKRFSELRILQFHSLFSRLFL